MAKLFFFLLVFTISSYVNAQELMCNISVNSSQIQSSDKKIFRTLQTAIYEFVNNTKWTNTPCCRYQPVLNVSEWRFRRY